MRLTFVQLRVFTSDWKALKLPDEDLRALEIELLDKPDGGRVIDAYRRWFSNYKGILP